MRYLSIELLKRPDILGRRLRLEQLGRIKSTETTSALLSDLAWSGTFWPCLLDDHPKAGAAGDLQKVRLLKGDTLSST
jgi:hypothetical protein